VLAFPFFFFSAGNDQNREIEIEIFIVALVFALDCFPHQDQREQELEDKTPFGRQPEKFLLKP
jgi:hypothetical protein